MTLFLISVFVVLAISACCSLTEAAIYAIRTPYVRRLSESGSASGQVLARFKENMERPITAILILNTAANTAGAAVAGAQARELFGDASLLWFSSLFTLSVLVFSEILPKVLGVVYSQPVARFMALPWNWVIKMMSPLIWIVEAITNLLRPSEKVMSAPEEEVEQMALMSAEEGSILGYEAQLVKNVLRLDDVRARQIMTPRPVVLKLPDDMTLGEAFEKCSGWVYSRIPVYSASDPETWVGYVLSREVLACLAQDQFDRKLAELSKPMFFVSEEVPGHVLLKAFLKQRTHLFGVMDDYGDLTGIVTLEDVLEALIGEEIVDEVDTVADMQEVARRRKREHFSRQERRSESPPRLSPGPPPAKGNRPGPSSDPPGDSSPAGPA